MLELENYRRNLHPAGIPHPGIQSNGTEPSLHPAGSSYPSFPSFQKNERQNPMANWSHDRSPLSSGPEPGYRSEEEDDEEYRPFTPPPPRERLSYTRYQLEMLNCIYTHARYPNSTQKQLIAKRVGITREQVKIWFQNRRRKDVVEKVKKKDKDEQDTSDTKSDHGDTKSDHGDTKSDHGDSDSGVSDTSSTSNTGEDHGKSMVPDVVMKSVLAELRKFEKDLLKPKKKIKKKSKVTKQKNLKSHFTSALLSGEYDIINPPNQVVPSSALQRSGNKFSHSPRSSAFETPRDSGKYPSLLESLGPMFSPGHSPSKSCLNNPLNIPTSSGACDIPVLSDLLRSEQKQKDNCAQGVSSSYLTHRDRPYDFSNHHPHFGSPYTTPYGYIYPYHFITEPAIMLSSLRHPDSYRPYGHYTPIPYEHISASQLANPYFPPLPPPASWTNPNQSNSSSTPDTSYEQL